MKYPLEATTERLLRRYSALTEYWDDEAGDTHVLRDDRELLVGRTLTTEQRQEMARVDTEVLRLVDALPVDAGGWDVLMLRKTADLIRAEQEKRAA